MGAVSGGVIFQLKFYMSGAAQLFSFWVSAPTSAGQAMGLWPVEDLDPGSRWVAIGSVHLCNRCSIG
eukprot:COSAG02_NODE_4578_length_5200_cov_2.867673_3_plen_67_part_00